jgi:hypothetical protein
MTVRAVAEMSDTPRVIASFDQYSGFVDALRARVAELQVSGQTIDQIAGLPSGYTQKILGPKGVRKVGAKSLTDLCGALAIRLLMVEDKEALARIANRLERRDAKMVRGGTVHIELSRRFLRKIQRKGGKNSRKNMTPEEASELGRRAALVRWGSSP